MIPFKIIRNFLSVIDPIEINPEKEKSHIYRFRSQIPDTWDEYYVCYVHVREYDTYRWQGRDLNYLEIHLTKENDVQEQFPFTFKDLKPYISTIDRISVCEYENLQYENYASIEYVGNEYDNRYVYGFGPRIIDYWNEKVKYADFLPVLEIMVSKEPRKSKKSE